MIAPDNRPPQKRDRSKDVDRSRLFTELSVSKMRLRAGEAVQITYRDKKQDGLLLRLNISGGKSWCVSFYDQTLRKMRTEKLGDFRPGAPDHMTVKAARDKAASFRAHKTGILADRAKHALSSRDSFEIVAERYLKRFVDGKRRSAPQMRKMVEKIYPVWGKKPFESLKRSDVSDLLDEIEEARGPRAADVTLAILRRMMSKHAVAHDDYSSPIREGMARIENPSERARDRILSDDEIRAMWKACEEQGTFGNLVKLLLLTAQRRIKVATMKWDDLNGDLWTIATEDREKGNAQRLKLPKAAIAIIEAQAEMRINDYVFPAGRVGRRDGPGQHFGSFSAFGQGKDDLDEAMAEIMPEIPQWQLHDLRRTARSLMSRAKVRPDIAERVLGHVIPGVAGVYDRYAYDVERAQALVSLSTLIGRILEPRRTGTVVPLTR